MNNNIDKFGSFSNYITKGCSYCKKGSKMVLFITGLCHHNCFYCPISIEKKNKDIIFANEKLILDKDDIIIAAMEMNAKGTGITGGEPMLKFNRVIEYITLLKNRFGFKHHIHLYTSYPISKKKLEILKNIGLDEIRFHPVLAFNFSNNSNYILNLYSNSILNA